MVLLDPSLANYRHGTLLTHDQGRNLHDANLTKPAQVSNPIPSSQTTLRSCPKLLRTSSSGSIRGASPQPSIPNPSRRGPTKHCAHDEGMICQAAKRDGCFNGDPHRKMRDSRLKRDASRDACRSRSRGLARSGERSSTAGASSLHVGSRSRWSLDSRINSY